MDAIAPDPSPNTQDLHPLRSTRHVSLTSPPSLPPSSPGQRRPSGLRPRPHSFAPPHLPPSLATIIPSPSSPLPPAHLLSARSSSLPILTPFIRTYLPHLIIRAPRHHSHILTPPSSPPCPHAIGHSPSPLTSPPPNPRTPIPPSLPPSLPSSLRHSHPCMTNSILTGSSFLNKECLNYVWFEGVVCTSETTNRSASVIG